MIFHFGNYLPLRSSISPQNQAQFQWFLIPWKYFEVLFHSLPFSPISIINSSSDLIKFEEIIINFLISLLIRPLFTIIPLNSKYIRQIGKFGLCFDMRSCEIDDLAFSSRQYTHLHSHLISIIFLKYPTSEARLHATEAIISGSTYFTKS